MQVSIEYVVAIVTALAAAVGVLFSKLQRCQKMLLAEVRESRDTVSELRNLLSRRHRDHRGHH